MKIIKIKLRYFHLVALNKTLQMIKNKKGAQTTPCNHARFSQIKNSLLSAFI